MSHERLSDISTEGRDFLSKLLEYNPTKRINVKDALQHPWLRRGDLPGDGNQLGCIENLRGYHKRWKNWVSY
jgi:serine/threonine protein kinase